MSEVAARQVTIVNKLGLHARAAAKFVTMASRFESDIHLIRDDRQVNGKSIMGVMMLAAGKGTVLELRADGPDAKAAVDGLAQLIDQRFEETE